MIEALAKFSGMPRYLASLEIKNLDYFLSERFAIFRSESWSLKPITWQFQLKIGGSADSFLELLRLLLLESVVVY